MDHFEKVEKLRERANISYAQAKDALEHSNWDLLDAMVYLEQQGQTAQGPETFSSKQAEPMPQPPAEPHYTFGDFMRSVGDMLRRLFSVGNQNHLEILRHGALETSIPVTAFVLLLIFGFWIILPLMLVGLFFGFGYRFAGPQLGREDVNNVMQKASSVAEDLKQEVREEIQKSTDKKDSTPPSDQPQ